MVERINLLTCLTRYQWGFSLLADHWLIQVPVAAQKVGALTGYDSNVAFCVELLKRQGVWGGPVQLSACRRSWLFSHSHWVEINMHLIRAARACLCNRNLQPELKVPSCIKAPLALYNSCNTATTQFDTAPFPQIDCGFQKQLFLFHFTNIFLSVLHLLRPHNSWLIEWN